MNSDRIKGNLIIRKSFDFALAIIEYAKNIEKEKNYVIANQLLKSGTSIGANCWEAQNCESKADFIHKMKISAKEAEETQYWLLLCKHANLNNCDALIDEIETIQKILNKIIHSSKQKK
ncbi:MAG: four helix bundle protein [Bacteroidetes bacterium]|nr:four helix bundle protein [Bacteroidota bacterium]